ncbi:MAG: hypothetical protein EA374_02380 [Acholeplasmatales bacterium]|nr:MAG: hypothetical protein EA374_02380 [Acholeplasmatales bacterium]
MMTSWLRRHAANSVTLFGISLALFAGINLLVFEAVGVATLIVFLCAGIDGLDGWLARRLGSASTVGRILDAVHDLLAFGVVPGLLGLVVLGDYGHHMFMLMTAFVLAMLFRLARSVLRNRPDTLLGLPAPFAGMSLVLACTVLFEADEPLHYTVFILVIILLMLIPFPIKRPCFPPSA